MAVKPLKQSQMPEKLLYDKQSAAYALSVSTKMIDRLIANKQLSYHRSGKGGKILIPAADIRRVAKLETLLGVDPNV